MTTNHQWRKSSRSSNADTCVELNRTLDAVRDSKNPHGPILPVARIVKFVNKVKSGQFDR